VTPPDDREANERAAERDAQRRAERVSVITISVGRPGRYRGEGRGNEFPPSVDPLRRIARVLRAAGSNLLTENQRALPVFWKRPLSMVGRHGLEPWTR